MSRVLHQIARWGVFCLILFSALGWRRLAQSSEYDYNDTWSGTITVHVVENGKESGNGRFATHHAVYNTTYYVDGLPREVDRSAPERLSWLGEVRITTSMSSQAMSDDEERTSHISSTSSGTVKDWLHIEFQADEPGRYSIVCYPESGPVRITNGKTIYKRNPPEVNNWRNEDTQIPGGVSVTGTIDPKSKTMSGTRTEQSGDRTETVTWNLRRGKAPDIEAVIQPEPAYKEWIPAANRDPEQPGKSLRVRVRLQKKGAPQAKIERTARFKLKLVEVSREPGVALNWPSRGADTSPDLRIAAGAKPLTIGDDKGQTAESPDEVTETECRIQSFDGGGYGKLQVTAVLDDGEEITARLDSGEGKNELQVPLDDNANHIADAWERNLPERADARADEDATPESNGVTGDGLSVYEEYRGFFRKGVHGRTDPARKDLFIYDEANLGLGLFAQSGIRTHLVSKDEYQVRGNGHNKNVINCNNGHAHLGDQHLLYLRNRNLPGLLGQAEGADEMGPPLVTEFVSINVAALAALGGADMAATIAHELAHATNVFHHGETDYLAGSVMTYGADERWHATPGDAGEWMVAVKGGQESGVQDCIMRYASATFYEVAGGRFAWKKGGAGPYIQGELYPADVPQSASSFCSAQEGTGINAADRPDGSVAGDATVGQCIRQFQVNDLKPAGRP